MSEMRAVRLDRYGASDVLDVRTVPRPSVAPDEVLVRVRAAGINPGEALIREGFFHVRFPASFPSGEGTDLAGVIVERGRAVRGFFQGNEVLGFTHRRASHAEYVAVPALQLTIKPAKVSWEVAGSLFIAGATAFACVNAVQIGQGSVVVIAGATGGVGSIAVQLARKKGAKVLGVAGPANDEWLRSHGVTPVNYGSGLAKRLVAAAPSGRVDSFLDMFGGGYVQMAVEELGVAAGRVNTIRDFDAVDTYNIRSVGSSSAGTVSTIAELADLIAAGHLDVPIAKTFPLEQVRAAYDFLGLRHSLGKVVLIPDAG